MSEIASDRKQDDMLSEYSFDYSEAKTNRFAGKAHGVTTVILDPDVAAVFKTSTAVNRTLRAILESLPPSQMAKRV